LIPSRLLKKQDNVSASIPIRSPADSVIFTAKMGF
jgi:aspartokinase-like uncharacterized kinase